jgi:hypothetical protein
MMRRRRNEGEGWEMSSDAPSGILGRAPGTARPLAGWLVEPLARLAEDA